jgi:hypothetical protein
MIDLISLCSIKPRLFLLFMSTVINRLIFMKQMLLIKRNNKWLPLLILNWTLDACKPKNESIFILEAKMRRSTFLKWSIIYCLEG